MEESFSHVSEGLQEQLPLVYTAMSKHLFYFKQHISKFVLENWGVPLNPFMLFDYFLLDSLPRDVIRQANNIVVEKSEEIRIFWPVSDGVLAEILLAKKANKPVKYFKIQKSKEILPISKEEVELEEDVKQYRDQL